MLKKYRRDQPKQSDHFGRFMPISGVMSRHGCLRSSLLKPGARSLQNNSKKSKQTPSGAGQFLVSNLTHSRQQQKKTCVATGQGSDSDPRLCPSLRLYEGVCLKMNENPCEFVPAALR